MKPIKTLGATLVACVLALTLGACGSQPAATPEAEAAAWAAG